MGGERQGAAVAVNGPALALGADEQGGVLHPDDLPAVLRKKTDAGLGDVQLAEFEALGQEGGQSADRLRFPAGIRPGTIR